MEKGNLLIYMLLFQTESEAQVIFLNPFTICPSCKRKFVVCSFVDEEKNGSYPFANGLTDLPISGDQQCLLLEVTQ
jgi:hypothetical protein